MSPVLPFLTGCRHCAQYAAEALQYYHQGNAEVRPKHLLGGRFRALSLRGGWNTPTCRIGA